MKKKLTLVVTCIVLVAAMVIGGTLAYFTDTKSAENTFTVGGVKITLTEPKWEETGKKDAETVYAGEPLLKDPTVSVNAGSNPCFVRIKVDGLKQFGDKGDIIYRTNYVNNALHEGWVLHTDGYFYWTKPLVEASAVKDSWNSKYNLTSATEPLFDQIVMPTGLVGDETASPIVVTAQAVQAQGAKAAWADVNTMTVAEIAAWFTTCGMK